MSLRSISKINILNCIIYLARKERKCHQNPGPGYKTPNQKTILERFKIGITFVSRSPRRPIQLVVIWTPAINYPGRATEETSTPNKKWKKAHRNEITNWLGQRRSLKVKVIPILILTEIFPSGHETWYLKAVLGSMKLLENRRAPPFFW